MTTTDPIHVIESRATVQECSAHGWFPGGMDECPECIAEARERGELDEDPRDPDRGWDGRGDR